MTLKDDVIVKITDLLFVEAKVVGYTLYKNKITYRIYDGKEIFDAPEEKVFDIKSIKTKLINH